MKKNNNDSEHNFLIGMTKRDIIETLGEGFNYYPDDVWIYEVKKTWWGKKTVLLVCFNKEHIVEETQTKSYFFELKV
ncbi:hypothetical protein [Elizabethkingia anophelis]|uniref:hypothetical protein n=1 Tax=Elizabethkingia anophelis TaxID=1117645 RepID=UPI0021A75B7E|nr:hypothetical protein [Elizabethkingia anophelis]MCT3719518.1 hypothetical protein [Elizabethkingia anophelis]MCT3723028.1 hypothetical protein [Elizabethkingia anophelis]MCT3788211.1 hypothetical protein [Elizabethkingia anophelis]MCT4004821.1 hypothetical protein [Elizabethkingia anophelis]